MVGVGEIGKASPTLQK